MVDVVRYVPLTLPHFLVAGPIFALWEAVAVKNTSSGVERNVVKSRSLGERQRKQMTSEGNSSSMIHAQRHL